MFQHLLVVCVAGALDRRIVCALIIGTVLFLFRIALLLFANQEGLRPILSYVTPIINGVVAASARRAFS